MRASRRSSTAEATQAARADTVSERLLDIYDRLASTYGAMRRHWYPQHVEGPLDVVVGAILVQHTSWVNAERALERLRAAGLLDLAALCDMPETRLIDLVRVSGTPSIKVRRLRAIARTIAENGGVDRFVSLPQDELRSRLLATHGVGEETADAIMLYAAGRRAFVIDAYTRRLFTRLALGPPGGGSYGAWRRWFERHLAGANAKLFQRYHAYIVLHGKALCRSQPRCASCPLLSICSAGTATVIAAGGRRQVDGSTPARSRR